MVRRKKTKNLKCEVLSLNKEITRKCVYLVSELKIVQPRRFVSLLDYCVLY